MLVHFSNIHRFLFLLKYHLELRFDSLIDIICVDYVSHTYRFQVIYNLLSIFFSNRLFIKTFLFEVGSLFSVSDLFFSALWLEREVFDFFGILFLNHPDLRRILNDYGFSGFPLRKDFPLTGFYEVRFDYSVRRIISTKIIIPQEFRFFDFKNSWTTLL